MKNRRMMRAAMMALMMLVAISAAAQYVVCTGNHVRLRTGPSTKYPMLVWTSTGDPVYIDKGEQLTYLGNDTPEFYNVEFDSKSVYISKKFARLVKAKNEVVDNQAKQVVVAGTNVRLRWGASLDAKVYANSKGVPIYPKKGARLTYLGDEGDFFMVRYQGNVLYISKDYSYLK